MLSLACAGCSALAVPPPEGPSVQDIVEYTWILQPRHSDQDALQSQVSPDGTKAFIVTRKANTRTDRNRYAFLLLDLRPDRLEAGKPAAPSVLLELDPLVDNNSAQPSVSDARWTDNRTIVFRARLVDDRFQVFKLDVETRRLSQLTHAPNTVATFAVARDATHLVYAAQHPNPPLAPGQRSLVMDNTSFWAAKWGQSDPRAQAKRMQMFVLVVGAREPARPLGEPFDLVSAFPEVNISPDGRWAMLPVYEPKRQMEWAQRYPLVQDATKRIGPSASIDPLRYFSRPQSFVPKRLVAYRLADGERRDVLDAPDDSASGAVNALWQRGGRSVVLAGTHLPAGARGDAEAARGSHLVEYWPDTGRWEVIAAVKGRVKSAYRLGSDDDAMAVVDDGRRYFRRKAGGGWEEMGSAPPPKLGWTLRFKEAPNVPTDIVAVGPGGQTVQLTTLNPQVSAAWGEMRPFAWKDAKGRQWDGGLMVPAGFDRTRKYPLVIQSYGFSPKRFYIDGSNVTDGFTSGFPGRAFLKEGILVLALPWRASTDAPKDSKGAVAASLEAVRSAVEALKAEGFVDMDRLGIMGWSATGERVLNQLTFTDVPFRAATILDGDANTLFSLAVTYAAGDNILTRKTEHGGGMPYGETLSTWVKNDPSLHTDCIKAALRIETYGPWVLNNYDIYALLRYQYKPVELVLIPEGTHGLSTPSERMISLQGNVDWYRFWLRGEERAEALLAGESDETLAEQYRRWQQMAELKRLDDAKPRCARALEPY